MVLSMVRVDRSLSESIVNEMEVIMCELLISYIDIIQV